MATTSSSAHVRKRPYQPSITSYFNRGDASQRERSSRSPLSPPLPAETQASLISVGMRVRKSVPEGYKTHKTLGMDEFPFPSTAPVLTYTMPMKGSYASGGAARELAPFCGLHKTGGLVMQEPGLYVPSSSAPPDMQSGDQGYENGVPALSVSQNTLASTQNSFLSASSASGGGLGGSRKRTYEEETEDEMDAFFDEVDVVNAVPSTRVIAEPKASLRKAATEPGMVVSNPGDFDEATFLAPMEIDA